MLTEGKTEQKVGGMTTSLSDEPLKVERGKHSNSVANLAVGRAKLAEKRKNGELTNPEGYSLTSALKTSLNKPFSKPALDAPVRDHIVYKTLKGAYDLVPVAFKETWERVEGKVPGDGTTINFNEIKILVIEALPPEQVKE